MDEASVSHWWILEKKRVCRNESVSVGCGLVVFLSIIVMLSPTRIFEYSLNLVFWKFLSFDFIFALLASTYTGIHLFSRISQSGQRSIEDVEKEALQLLRGDDIAKRWVSHVAMSVEVLQVVFNGLWNGHIRMQQTCDVWSTCMAACNIRWFIVYRRA